MITSSTKPRARALELEGAAVRVPAGRASDLTSIGRE